ncbi:MAG: hypothetical protein IT174_14595 [Acidobacteria bacterium]|nr:hypothetical protein [Acidobacteriota bacterium]
MIVGQKDPSSERLVFTSSVDGEVWHPEKSVGAYEWWYFDALSDAGNEAVSIVFLDTRVEADGADERLSIPPSNSVSLIRPAVSFTYFSGGKIVCQAKADFPRKEFSASDSSPRCSIGESGFRFDSAIYGSGYLVSVALPLSRGRRLRADLEWLAIESDLDPVPGPIRSEGHWWNMVAPRCDVSGKITIEGPRDSGRESHSFRGTGYHDQHLDEGWLTGSLSSWQWGRAHFADSTAVFCRFSGPGCPEGRSMLLLTGDGTLRSLEPVEQGGSVPENGKKGFDLVFTDGAEDLRLRAVPQQLIESNFYRQRFLTAITLNAHGHEHVANGLSEIVAPPALRYRMLSWLGRLRATSGL